MISRKKKEKGLIDGIGMQGYWGLNFLRKLIILKC